MYLLVASQQDVASLAIKQSLLATSSWEVFGEFEGCEVYKHENFLLITLQDLHIYAENFDAKVKAKFGDFEKIIVLSRHKSEAGVPTLTVHPVGNFGKAEFGGKDFEVSPAPAETMGGCLRRMWALGRGLEYKISLEVTHHGPYVETPIMFIEIGSDESRWRDESAALVIAKTILEFKEEKYPVVLGIGGGHYAPRFTDMLLTRKLNFAHMIPEYAIPNLTLETLAKVLSKPRPDYIYVHEKGLKKSNLKKIEEMLSSFDIPQCSSKDFEPLEGPSL